MGAQVRARRPVRPEGATVTAPQEVYERIARTVARGLVLHRVSVCHTLHGAERVARKYEYAEIRPDRNTGTVEVWAATDGD